MKEFKTLSQQETTDIGVKLGKVLQKGDIVCLIGDLGTGKTAFAKGIAEALGIEGYITSPTFTLVNEYKVEAPLYHFDVYRLSEPEELYEIGFEEYISGEGIVVLEWADRVLSILPKEYIWIEIKKSLSEDQDVRLITMQFVGDRYKSYEERLSVKD